MNFLTNLVDFGNESISLMPNGLYHAEMDIDGESYHRFDRNPFDCLDYLFEIKKIKGAGKFSDFNTYGMYEDCDVQITIEDNSYTVRITILDREFKIHTDCRKVCLRLLEVLGNKRSRRLVESFRSSLARYAYDVIRHVDITE